MDETEKDKFAGRLTLLNPHLVYFSEPMLRTDNGLCVQARRWSSSALEKVFSTTPSRVTMPVSLPMDKLVITNRQLAGCMKVTATYFVVDV